MRPCSRSSSCTARLGGGAADLGAALANARFGPQASIVFAWIFTAHQFGAATAAWAAGLIRTETGEYTAAFLAAGGLALVAASTVPLIRRAGRGADTPLPVPMS